MRSRLPLPILGVKTRMNLPIAVGCRLRFGRLVVVQDVALLANNFDQAIGWHRVVEYDGVPQTSANKQMLFFVLFLNRSNKLHFGFVSLVSCTETFDLPCSTGIIKVVFHTRFTMVKIQVCLPSWHPFSAVMRPAAMMDRASHEDPTWKIKIRPSVRNELVILQLRIDSSSSRMTMKSS